MNKIIRQVAIAVVFALGAGSLGWAAEQSSDQGSDTMPQIKLSDTVVKKELAEDVTIDDAIQSMRLRANLLNFKEVGYLPLSKELEARGIQSKRLEIFEFCDAGIAKDMVDHDVNFAAYLPCRIAVVEAKEGRPYLVMLNPDLFIQAADLPSELQEKANQVRDTLNEIMEAGANGEL